MISHVEMNIRSGVIAWRQGAAAAAAAALPRQRYAVLVISVSLTLSHPPPLALPPSLAFQVAHDPVRASMLHQLQMEPDLASHPTAYMCGVEQKKREMQLAQKRFKTADDELKPRQVEREREREKQRQRQGEREGERESLSEGSQCY